MTDQSTQPTQDPQSMVDAALTPLVPPAPVAPQAPSSVAMGDDTPLAFAMPSPSTSSTTTSEAITTVEQPSSYLPPVPAAPTTIAPEQPKKKKKVGLVIGGVVALLLFIVGGVGGYYYYTQRQLPLIAKSEEEKVNQHKDGYAGQIQQNQAAAEQVYQNNLVAGTTGTPTQQQAAKDALTEKIQADIQKAKDQLASIGTSNPYSNSATPGMFIGDDNKKHVIQAPGVFEGVLARAAVAGTGSEIYLQSKEALTNAGLPANASQDDYMKVLAMINQGYTWVPGGVGCNGTNPTTNDPAGIGSGVDLNGTTVGCGVPHFTKCQSNAGVNGVGCDVKKVTTNGVETYVDATAPTMSCTSLTSVPAVTPTAPVIGAKLVFTCLGAVTPASAGTLSYKFRYSLNSGAVTALTNKTATTAELTINACGTYSVECQACATLNGVLTCNPVWTGATQ